MGPVPLLAAASWASALDPTPAPAGGRWICGGEGKCVVADFGHISHEKCEATCHAPSSSRWACGGEGKCVAADVGHASREKCEPTCHAPPPGMRYTCGGFGQCYQKKNGTDKILGDCINSCATAPPNACDQAGACLDGVTKLGYGFNVVTGELAQRPAIAFSFAEHKTFEQPGTGATKIVPDQVDAIDDTATSVSAQSEVFYDVKSFAQSQQSSAGLGFGIPGFSLSSRTQLAESVLSQSATYSAFSETSFFVSWYRASLPPATRLRMTDEFTNAAAALPEEYSDATAAQFTAFIEKFGTHYVDSGRFGGQGFMFTSVSRSWSDTEARSGTSTASGIGVKVTGNTNKHFAWLKLGGDKSGQTDTTDSSFRSSSSFSELLVGGQPGIYTDITQWNDWVASVPNYPALISMTLRNYSAVMGDTKRVSALWDATVAYMNQNPYPADPTCSREIMCPDSTCCSLAAPMCDADCGCLAPGASCCGGGQCAAGYSCCGDSCMPDGATCCDDGHFCGSGDQCCYGYCIPSGAGCCDSGHWCDVGHNHCCSAHGGYCCPDGWHCAGWIDGCSPVGEAGSLDANTTRAQRVGVPRSVPQPSPGKRA